MQCPLHANGGRMTTGKRGFASMDRNRQREIASKGGKLAHLRGQAHEWTPEEAREAGRKGGSAVRQRKPASNSDCPDQQ
jgi:general stress protein YciG